MCLRDDDATREESSRGQPAGLSGLWQPGRSVGLGADSGTEARFIVGETWLEAAGKFRRVLGDIVCVAEQRLGRDGVEGENCRYNRHTPRIICWSSLSSLSPLRLDCQIRWDAGEL